MSLDEVRPAPSATMGGAGRAAVGNAQEVKQAPQPRPGSPRRKEPAANRLPGPGTAKAVTPTGKTGPDPKAMKRKASELEPGSRMSKAGLDFFGPSQDSKLPVRPQIKAPLAKGAKQGAAGKRPRDAGTAPGTSGKDEARQPMAKKVTDCHRHLFRMPYCGYGLWIVGMWLERRQVASRDSASDQSYPLLQVPSFQHAIASILSKLQAYDANELQVKPPPSLSLSCAVLPRVPWPRHTRQAETWKGLAECRPVLHSLLSSRLRL